MVFSVHSVRRVSFSVRIPLSVRTVCSGVTLVIFLGRTNSLSPDTTQEYYLATYFFTNFWLGAFCF